MHACRHAERHYGAWKYFSFSYAPVISSKIFFFVQHGIFLILLIPFAVFLSLDGQSTFQRVWSIIYTKYIYKHIIVESFIVFNFKKWLSSHVVDSPKKNIKYKMIKYFSTGIFLKEFVARCFTKKINIQFTININRK